MNNYFIFGVTHDDGDYSDPDEAIDKYHYWRTDEWGDLVKRWDWRQNVVDKVKRGEAVCYTYPEGHRGALCEVKVSRRGVEFLKTVPNSDPGDNLSALPEM